MGYNVLQSMILQLTRDRGLSVEDASKIATKHLQNTWYLNQWSMQLSESGKEVSEKSWNDRKRIRATKKSNRPDRHYIIWIDGKPRLNPLYKDL